MKAPSQNQYYYDTSNLSNENKQNNFLSPQSSPPPSTPTTESSLPFSDSVKTTASLMKFIGDVTIKRRQIRRKYRCGNLLAEAVLSNALREAKKELLRKQEEKRKNLQTFTYNVTINYSNVGDENNKHFNNNNNSSILSGKDLVLDSALQNCLSSLDSFFNELKEIKT